MFLVGERQAVRMERPAELIERLGPDPMELPDLGLAHLGKLLESLVAGRCQRPLRRLSQLSRRAAVPLVAPCDRHGGPSSFRCSDEAMIFESER